MVVDHRRDAREGRVEEGELRRGLERLLVEGRVEPPPDLLEDLAEGARRLGGARHPARERRIEVRVGDREARHDEAARRVELAARRGPEEDVAPLDRGRVERDDGAARDREPACAGRPGGRPRHQPRTSRSRRSTSPASAAWSAHQRSERCASSSATVFPCCSTHVKYFRLCHRSRFSTVPSVIQSSFWPWKIDARCASARSRVSGPVVFSRRRRTDGYRSRPSVATVTTASSLPRPSHCAVRIAPRMLQTPLTPRSVESRFAASPRPARRREEVAPGGLGDELQAEQALLVVDRHDGVHVRDVVDPGDVLVADPLDRVAAVAVPRERRALDRARGRRCASRSAP